jgi:hypothetical protein
MASGNLSLHDVNEACSLIRSATSNDDVQVNFGVVMSDNMGDEVKMTVIATGFEREGIPIPERAAAAVAASSNGSHSSSGGGSSMSMINRGNGGISTGFAQHHSLPPAGGPSFMMAEPPLAPIVRESREVDPDDIFDRRHAVTIPSVAQPPDPPPSQDAMSGGQAYAVDSTGSHRQQVMVPPPPPPLSSQAATAAPPQPQAQDDSYNPELDIPAFLRRGKRMFQ